MEHKQLFKILAIAILFVLVFPTIQEFTGLVHVRKLRGAIAEKSKPEFNLKDWFSGEYQEKADAYTTQHFGFRNDMVRLNNQLAFWLFNKALANGVVIGKHNYLYERGYIDAFLGTDFIGKEKIAHKVAMLKAISDTLQSMGKHLVVVFAAGKASFYPEYIPDELTQEKGITNNEYYGELIRKEQIPFIDFNTWFCQAKDTSRYVLYPKTGIHWSTYGMTLAMDSMFRYLEHLRGIDMTDVLINDIKLKSNLRDGDRDIEEGMNLLFGIPKPALAYPNIRFKEEGKQKPRALVVSDSFFWEMYNMGVATKVFDNGRFWYYNSMVYPDKKKAGEMDMKQALGNTDLVILMATEATVDQFAWGFIERCHNVLFKHGVPLEKPKPDSIKIMKEKIRKDEKWMEQIREKAKKNRVSVDSMITRDAIYMVKQLEQKNK